MYAHYLHLSFNNVVEGMWRITGVGRGVRRGSYPAQHHVEQYQWNIICLLRFDFGDMLPPAPNTCT